LERGRIQAAIIEASSIQLNGRVQKSSRAESDLIEIADFIASENINAALRWVDEIDQLFRLLAENPFLGELVENLSPEVRRQTFGKYLVFYKPTDEGIVIVRVLHGSREIKNLRD
jgi:toxin ParE1/3/4